MALRGHQGFFINTIARYECLAGHVLEGKNSSELTLECQADGKWNKDPNMLPSCKPVTCDPLPKLKNGILEYKMKYSNDKSLAGTILKYSCPKNKYFVERTNEFWLSCSGNG